MKTVKLLPFGSRVAPVCLSLLFFLLTVLFLVPAHGQFVYWDFSGGSLSGVSSESYITADDAYEGPGVATSGFPDAACSNSEPWSVRGWYNTSSVFDAINRGDYVAFSLSVAPGHAFRITGISFLSNRSVNAAGDEFGPRSWAVYGSHDNYAGLLFSGNNSTGETGGSASCDFNSESVDILLGGGQSITFRIYAYADAATEISTMRFDDFTVDGTLLPVELSHFSVREDQGNALLQWETATEETNDYFAVERSADGESFLEIGRVRGAGTTQAQQTYRFSDDAPLPGINYYRLRQVDLDGSATHFQVVSIRLAGKRAEIKVYPTLAHTHLTVSFPEPPTRDASLHFFDVMGREVRQIVVPGGAWQQQINIADLAAGPYVVQYREDKQLTKVSRFIRQ